MVGAGGATADTDNRTKTISAAVIALSSAANQTFAIGDPNTVASTITVNLSSGKR